MFLKLALGPHTIHAIIDTGATRSFMSPDLASQLHQVALTQPQPFTVYMADGSAIQITEKMDIPFQVGNDAFVQPILILPQATEELILGMDFLRRIGASFHCCPHLAIKLRQLTDENKSQHRYTSICHQKSATTTTTEEVVTTTPDDLAIQTSITGPEELLNEKPWKKFLSDELQKFEGLKGTTTLTEHHIKMKDGPPVKQRYTQRNPAMLEIIYKEVDELLNQGCIEPSHSPYSSPVVLVKKKTGKWRLCIDFRQINARSEKDAYPIPRILSILDRLRGAQYISTLDLKNGRCTPRVGSIRRSQCPEKAYSNGGCYHLDYIRPPPLSNVC